MCNRIGLITKIVIMKTHFKSVQYVLFLYQSVNLLIPGNVTYGSIKCQKGLFSGWPSIKNLVVRMMSHDVGLLHIEIFM